jgi:hypothetical protein
MDTVKPAPPDPAFERLGAHARREGLRAGDVAVLALGEAGERPVATKSEVENLTEDLIAPEIGRFSPTRGGKLPIARM